MMLSNPHNIARHISYEIIRQNGAELSGESLRDFIDILSQGNLDCETLDWLTEEVESRLPLDLADVNCRKALAR